MKYPNLLEERKLWKKGYKYVVGLDEAGRGCLAGPVVAAAVLINSKFKIQNSKLLKGINDSKKLSPKKREELYRAIIKNSYMEWGIGRVSEKVIDKINILEATKLAMKKAINNLNCKLKMANCKIDFLILDGNFTLPADFVGRRPLRRPKAEALAKAGVSLPLAQKSIVKADEKVFSCAAASILAKVTRDRLMEKYDKKYPQYGFDRHKGYPTKLHLRALKKYSFCKIYRRSFRPVRKILKIKDKK